IARDGPLVGDIPDALLDPREEVAGHDPTHDALGELDATARVGLDLQPHMPELASATGLLLVPALDLGRSADGLAIGHARRMGEDGRPELALEALGGDGDLVLALCPQDLLAGLHLSLDPDGGILLDEARQSGGELVHVRL